MGPGQDSVGSGRR